MQLGVILASLRDLADLELDTLALAVAAEQSRRDSSLPPPEAAPSPPPPQPEADPEPRSEVVAFTTRYGRVWHPNRRCRHLRGRALIEHTAQPPRMRPCKTCSPPSQSADAQSSEGASRSAQG